MNQYYTPSMDEFYAGFEFEGLQKNGQWKELIYSCQDNYTRDLVKDGKVRVRKIDDTDIQSLGWRLATSSSIITSYYKRLGVKTDNTTLFLHIEPNKRVTISKLERNNNSKELFSGDIKNKSELVRISKMIKV